MKHPERISPGVGGLLAVDDRATGYVEGLPAVAAAAIDAAELELRPPPPARPARRGKAAPDAWSVLVHEFGRPPGKPTPPGQPRRYAWVGTKGLGSEEHPGVEIVVVESHRGRVTGHAVACGIHGAFPELLREHFLAVVIAGRHLELEHDGRGHVRLSRGRGRA